MSSRPLRLCGSDYGFTIRTNPEVNEKLVVSIRLICSSGMIALFPSSKVSFGRMVLSLSVPLIWNTLGISIFPACVGVTAIFSMIRSVPGDSDLVSVPFSESPEPHPPPQPPPHPSDAAFNSFPYCNAFRLNNGLPFAAFAEDECSPHPPPPPPHPEPQPSFAAPALAATGLVTAWLPSGSGSW